MKAERLGERFESVHHEPNTFGCDVDCLPKLIRERAYQIYEARGCEPGHEWEDWFRAEREIKHHLGL